MQFEFNSDSRCGRIALQRCPSMAAMVTLLARSSFSLGLIVALVGCQSYERRPLDLAAHHDAFLARETQSDAVQTLVPSNPASALSVDAAEELAILLHPQLRLARWRAGVAQATRENVGLWADPTIGFDLTRILEGPNAGWELLGSVGLTLPVSGRLSRAEDAAHALVEVEAKRIASLEWETRATTRQAYIAWAAAHLRREEMRAFARRLDRIVELVAMLESRGEIARIEARLFRMEEIETRGALIELDAQDAQARIALLREMGLAPTATLSFDPTALLRESDRVPVDGVLSHPRIALVEAEYEAAERALALEIQRQYPDLQLGPGYGKQDGDRQFVLGLGFALPLWNANRQAIGERAAQREVARVAAEIAIETLVVDRALAEADLALSKAQYEIQANEVIPMVEAQSSDVRRLADLGGEIDALILLDSLKRVRDARLSLVDATEALRLAETRCRALRGPVVPTSDAPSPAMEVMP